MTVVPPFEELAITSDEALSLEELPKRAVILGGGYIAVEFASIWKGMGSTVDLCFRRELPLRGFDDEMRAVVARNLEGRQINLHPRTNLTEFYQDLANSEKALECLQRVLQIDGRFTKANYLLLHGMGEHRAVRHGRALVRVSFNSNLQKSDYIMIEMWDWHGEGYCLQKETNLDISPCLCDGVSQNEEDLSYMFDETTAVKACGDLAYHVADNVNMDKELQQCTEMSSQVKRRRMLQFDNEILGSPLCNEEISSVFLKSKEREDSLEEALSDMSHWVSGFEEETSATGHEGLDQSSEGWLADCFNNDEMHCSPDDLCVEENYKLYEEVGEG
ncbi:unnamed protein product [Camellia sinensis]